MGSFTEKWLPEFKLGDVEATEEVWQRAIGRIVRGARYELKALGVPCRVFDEDDVTQDVFLRLSDMAAGNQLEKVGNSRALWSLLARITSKKVVDRIRFETAKKRGRGKVRGESACGQNGNASKEELGLHQFVSEDHSAESQVLIKEQVELLLSILPDKKTRAMVHLSLQGYSRSEIATKLGLSKSGVQRKYQIILSYWNSELDHE